MSLTPDDVVPMHHTLKARVLVAAKQYRVEQAAFIDAARAVVLCPPDCDARHTRFPQEHCHTFWDMWRSAQALDYAWQLQQRQRESETTEAMDTTPHLRRAGVGDIHLRGMAGLELTRPAVRAARKWLAQPRPMVDGRPGPLTHPWLLLTGSAGTGKTQAAACVLSHFIRRHPWNSQAGGGRESGLRPFVMIHAEELAALARQLRDFSAAGPAREREEELRRAKVLVIDDIGSEKLDADTLGLLHSLADGRYRERRTTVWTANQKPAELERRLDFGGTDARGERGRLWRRIQELAAIVQLGKATASMRMGDREVPLE